MVLGIRKIAAVSLFAVAMGCAHARTPPPEPTFHLIYGVADWHALVPEKATEFRTYRTIVLTNPNLSDDEKAARVARKYAEISTAVRAARTEADASMSEVRGIGNSATNGGGYGPKKVKAKCIGASREYMYTTPYWARGAYRSSDNAEADADLLKSGRKVNPVGIVANSGKEVCAIALKQSGKGRKISYSEATFRIRPERIKVMVDAELPALMYAITTTSV